MQLYFASQLRENLAVMPADVLFLTVVLLYLDGFIIMWFSHSTETKPRKDSSAGKLRTISSRALHLWHKRNLGMFQVWADFMRPTCMFPAQFCTQSATATSSLCFTILSFTWTSRTSRFMLSWCKEKTRRRLYIHTETTVGTFKEILALHLLVAVMEDEDDGGGEEDGDQADTEAEDPVVADSDVEVEGGEHGAPHHHIQHLWEEEEEAP